jgi:TatD DNase family protein
MSFFVDTHCHLDLFPDIKARVNEENHLPIKTITVTNMPSLWQPNNKLFAGCENIRVALGLHPELATQRVRETTTFNELCPKAKYIGEIGLDGTSKEKSVRDTQLKVFKDLLNAIKDQEPKVLTVHSRSAAAETIELLTSKLKNTQHQIILHWYSGGLADLRKAVGLGYYFSINHKMVASKNGLSIIKELPKSKVLTETDSPFTFTDKIATREQSLQETINGLSREWGKESAEVKQDVWVNFKNLLKMAFSNPS